MPDLNTFMSTIIVFADLLSPASLSSLQHDSLSEGIGTFSPELCTMDADIVPGRKSCLLQQYHWICKKAFRSWL